jgi:phosphopentomutase
MLGDIISKLNDDDLLIITADHGNDPTTPSTDHSREYVPFVVVSRSATQSKNLGDIDGMWTIGATIADALGVEWQIGKSVL